MPFSTATKNTMLDSFTADLMSLHNGDPGGSGTSNEITGGGYARVAATFAAASGGERLLSSDVDFTATALQAVTHFGVWTNAGTVFRGSAALTGDAAFNAAGEYTVKATTTKLDLNDS